MMYCLSENRLPGAYSSLNLTIAEWRQQNPYIISGGYQGFSTMSLLEIITITRIYLMTITQEWDNPEKTVYRIEFNERWTWADFDAAIDESNRMMAAQAPAKVDLILCIDAVLPPGNAMPHLRHAGGTQPPNTHRSV